METAKTSRPNTIYLVWMGLEGEQYYNQYFSLEEAVSDNDENVDIYQANLKVLGQFKVVMKLVKKKQSKRLKGKK